MLKHNLRLQQVECGEMMSGIHTRWHHCCLWSIAVCALVMLTGCRRSDTVSVTGQITLNGVTLPTGAISLMPIEKTAGPSVGCEIVEGHYNISATRGPLRGGKYRVEIRSIDLESGSTAQRDGGPLPVFQDRVPTAYNSASQLTLSVPSDATSVQQDFNLDSRAGKK
jgi:hypothetical protein